MGRFEVLSNFHSQWRRNKAACCILWIIRCKYKTANAVVQLCDRLEWYAKATFRRAIEHLFGVNLRADPWADQQLSAPKRHVAGADPLKPE